MQRYDLAVFDLDGTLIDSDEALVQPFVDLGVPRDAVSFGHPIELECRRLGLRVDDYVDRYDTSVVEPYTGVEEMLATLGRWAVCSNKHPTSGWAELARLGWHPELAMFSDDFGGMAKSLGPVLEALAVPASSVLFIGDTGHDEQCARNVGCGFAWAGWNRRTVATDLDGIVLTRPGDLLALLG